MCTVVACDKHIQTILANVTYIANGCNLTVNICCAECMLTYYAAHMYFNGKSLESKVIKNRI